MLSDSFQQCNLSLVAAFTNCLVVPGMKVQTSFTHRVLADKVDIFCYLLFTLHVYVAMGYGQIVPLGPNFIHLNRLSLLLSIDASFRKISYYHNFVLIFLSFFVSIFHGGHRQITHMGSISSTTGAFQYSDHLLQISERVPKTLILLRLFS